MRPLDKRGKNRSSGELGCIVVNANGKEEIGTSPGQNPPRTAKHRHIGNFERIHPVGDSSTGRLHSLVEPDDDGELPDVVGEASCEERKRRRLSTKLWSWEWRRNGKDEPIDQ